MASLPEGGRDQAAIAGGKTGHFVEPFFHSIGVHGENRRQKADTDGGVSRFGEVALAAEGLDMGDQLSRAGIDIVGFEPELRGRFRPGGRGRKEREAPDEEGFQVFHDR
jgi:hypothetical protein